MPHFTVKLFPGKSDEQKKALTAKIVAKPDILPYRDSLYKVPDYI